MRSTTLSTAVQDALAAVAALVAVAQLDRLVGTGRGARRDGRAARPTPSSVSDRDLDRRVAARIEDLLRVDELDDGHLLAAFRTARLPAATCGTGRSWSTAMPGSSLPSRNSRLAPPPVETCVN